MERQVSSKLNVMLQSLEIALSVRTKKTHFSAMCFFLPCDIWWPVWGRARAASSIGTVSSVPAWFRADAGMNLIKNGEIVTDRPCGSVIQWSECSHGLPEVLCSSPGRAVCFLNVTGEEKAHGPTGTRTQDVTHTVQAL